MEREFFLGNRAYDTTREINDDNIEELLQNKTIDYSIHLNGYFQSPAILSNPEIQQCYRRYMHPRPSPVDKDLFVHVRLGDITNLHSLPYAYYCNSIKQVQFSSGVIASDSPNSDLVQQLAAEFNLDILEDLSPIGTICYGSQFKNLVLSAGTFSFLTAFYAAPDANLWYIDIYRPSIHHDYCNSCRKFWKCIFSRQIQDCICRMAAQSWHHPDIHHYQSN